MPDQEEEDDQVFIIRLRLERFEGTQRQPTLRGVAEHINLGTRRYFKSLRELRDYLAKALRDQEWQWEE